MAKKNMNLMIAIGRSGLTCKTLSERSGIHRTTISLMLNARRRPKPETLKRLARALDCTVDEIAAVRS